MKYIAIFFIRLYQKIPGPWHRYCKFQPTCSEYAIGVFREFGFFKGLYLSIRRVIRCNPKSSGGYDPIPQKEKKMKKINKQRKDYLSWEQYFMGIARLSAMRSKDPNTQVGACIVGSDNRILSIGYNGSPNGFKDEYFPWDREGEPLDTKYMYVCHAEMNAILNYRGNTKELENAKIYVDLFPCNECAKLIIQAGIKEVIYLSDKYAHTNGTIASKRLFDNCGVKYRQIELAGKEIKLDL